MKNSKKAMIFQIGMVVVTLAVLSFALLTINHKYKILAGSNEIIGSEQINIIETYQKAEKTLFYIDQSAKLSAEQAIYELGQKGGHYTTSKCGSYLGYNKWNTKDRECYPNFKENFKSLVNDNINKYLESYPEKTTQTKLKNINYEFTIYDNKIIGTALENLKINITGEKGIIGTYSIKPSFNIDLYYDLNQYNVIIDNVKDILTLCRSKSTDKIEPCINNFLNTKTTTNWNFEQRIENLFLFDVKTDKKVWVASKPTQEDVTIKFALDLS